MPTDRSLGVALALAGMLGATACGRGPATVTISVVGTNDLHGGVLARNGQGGLPLFGGYLANLRAARARDGGAVVLLDAGDMFQGTLESNLTEGAVVVAAYNGLGYDAAAIGNHDFDYGPEGDESTPTDSGQDPRGALKARAAEARFPFLAANILDTATQRPVDWPGVRPSALLEVDGVRIGLVGLTTRETLRTTISMNTGGLAIAPLTQTLATEAAMLRQAGASVVIGVAHAGGSCTAFDAPGDLSSCGQQEEIFEVARGLPSGAVDVIVAGHRHQRVAHEVAGVAIIESGSGGRAFGRVDLTVDRATGRVLGHRVFPPEDICARQDAQGGCVDEGTAAAIVRQYEGRPVEPQAAIEAILAPAVQAAQARKETALNVRVDAPIRRRQDRESPLGDLMVEMMVKELGPADVAILNSGGLRADVPAGPLTYGRLYEVFPFDNRVARLGVTGDELRRVVESNLTRSGSRLLMAGVRATAACLGPALEVRLQRDNGTPVKPTEQLQVVTLDFLATGGDGFFDAIEPLKILGSVSDGPIFRDALALSLMNGGGMLRAPSPRSGGLVFPGLRPVTCESAQ
ncbi:MAG: bifunctional metallophosphatase/5'-nucleotidase [Acidobacteriota bacterium]|nr:bifunctional metallophosphatase/5'-nucleotidase [Acidobacteriota bacterium]